MITAVFTKSGSTAGFTLTGHSDLAEHGSDVLCAAVSSAAMLICNTVTDVLCDPTAEVSVEDDRISLTCAQKGTDMVSALLLHMQLLSQQYPGNILIKEVKS
ncbi:MAG: ribosomal-processing cysteine protease Prp [Oscillospiraceae bacterium]|nr:ribosomal-processing cysteine protease Prp [Oscillospiraceae bacterium]